MWKQHPRRESVDRVRIKMTLRRKREDEREENEEARRWSGGTGKQVTVSIMS
jgi:hypothetical protein